MEQTRPTPKSTSLLKYLLLAAWMSFTVALVIWWFLFGVAQLNRLRQLDVQNAPELARQHSMLLWEGGTLIISVIAGGIALAWYVMREVRETRRLRLFFLTLTHDLKTPLARLRLILEQIADQVGEQCEGVQQAQSEATRLNLLVENSLMLAQLRDEPLTAREVVLSDIVRRLQEEWPMLSLCLHGDCVLQADVRALESIFRNLASNAVLHGGATQLDIRTSATTEPAAVIHVTVTDNGTGAAMASSHLGTEPQKPSHEGSGIGLYLSRMLAERMFGALRIVPRDRSGFVVEIVLPGRAR